MKLCHLLELLQTKVLRHDQDLLTMLIRSENLRALANDKNPIVSVEEPEEIVRV